MIGRVIALGLALALLSSAGPVPLQQAIAQPQGGEGDTEVSDTGTNPSEIPDIAPGERPAPGSVEAGLWMQMDEMENRLRRSGRVVTDPELNAYIKGIVCDLAPDYCPHLRIYIVRTPHFNASMAPNGVMQVWTGLIARSANEAQLAYILGHEIGHYVERHSVKRWHDLRNKTDATTFLQVLTAAAGVGFAGNLIQLATIGSIFAYSRDHERDADRVGFDLMVKAGYDPGEAAKSWAGLVKERELLAADKPLIFFSTHPATEERIATLTNLAETVGGGRELTKGTDAFHAATAKFRGGWLRDLLRQRNFAGTELILERLLTTAGGAGELQFFRGELYRQRRQDGDLDRAIEAYEAAGSEPQFPTETYRGLGLAYWEDDQPKKAADAFRAYLKTSPEADDRAIIESYLEELQ